MPITCEKALLCPWTQAGGHVVLLGHLKAAAHVRVCSLPVFMGEREVRAIVGSEDGLLLPVCS